MIIQNILSLFLFIVLVILIILIIILIVKNKCEGFTFKNSSVYILPLQTKLFLYNQNNKMIILSNINKQLKFILTEGYIQLSSNQYYLDFDRIHLVQTIYLLYLYPNKTDVRHKWYFQKIQNNQFYIYQKIAKEKIYLFIDNQVLIGDAKNKSTFIIQNI
jgi:hypothetical protein